jgi:glycerophosphoryl diester phosphodiesterase
MIHRDPNTSFYWNMLVRFLLLALLVGACAKDRGSGRVEKNYTEYVPAYPFRASDFDSPVVSAHRGTPHKKGYPENSMASARYMSQFKPMMLEVDVRQAFDGELVLFHDDYLERLTTGTDKMHKFDVDELQQLLLKDNEGNITDFHIPTLRRLLDFNKNRQLFTIFLDIKQGASYKSVADLVRETRQEKNTILIAYSLSAAFALNQVMPEAVISVPVRNLREWSELKESGFPLEKVVAFTGTIRSESVLLDSLLAHDIAPVMGTMGNIDRQAEARGNDIYRELAEEGIKIFSTDRPVEVFNWLESEYYNRSK